MTQYLFVSVVRYLTVNLHTLCAFKMAVDDMFPLPQHNKSINGKNSAPKVWVCVNSSLPLGLVGLFRRLGCHRAMKGVSGRRNAIKACIFNTASRISLNAR